MRSASQGRMALIGCPVQVPAWPFIMLSTAFTAFALLPYFAGVAAAVKVSCSAALERSP